MIASCTAVGYRCELRQRGAEDVTGGSGAGRRTPTSLSCSQTRCMTYPFGSSSETTAAGDVIPAACSSANGSASSPAWRSCGPRARDTSRDGLSIAIMRPGQAVDTSPGGPLVRRQQRARSGTSRRIAVGDPRTAVTAAISRSSHLGYGFSFGARRPMSSSALATSTSSRRSRWVVKPGLSTIWCPDTVQRTRWRCRFPASVCVGRCSASRGVRGPCFSKAVRHWHLDLG